MILTTNLKKKAGSKDRKNELRISNFDQSLKNYPVKCFFLHIKSSEIIAITVIFLRLKAETIQR